MGVGRGGGGGRGGAGLVERGGGGPDKKEAEEIPSGRRQRFPEGQRANEETEAARRASAPTEMKRGRGRLGEGAGGLRTPVMGEGALQ